jgi:hypothetical protein
MIVKTQGKRVGFYGVVQFLVDRVSRALPDAHVYLRRHRLDDATGCPQEVVGMTISGGGRDHCRRSDRMWSALRHLRRG